MKKRFFHLLFLGITLSMVIYACNTTPEEEDLDDEEEFDPNSALNTVFDGKIFSIPSPVQMGYLVKQLKLEYDPTILNDERSVKDYVNEYKQSLNLGIYGTDLGYTVLYNQKNKTLEYLATIENLTTELGLDAAFDPDFMDRFERNISNEDSMIFIMTNAFKEADNFLKTANRKSTSALILAGGWVESLYLACRLNEKRTSNEIRIRIGEQKESLNTIVELLTVYNKSGSNDILIKELMELKTLFDQIKMNYEYVAPETDKTKKITTLNHSMTVEFSDKLIQDITSKTIDIRTNIIKK